MHPSVHSNTINTILAKTWKQPKCPPTDEWIKKTWYTHTHTHTKHTHTHTHTHTLEYYSAIIKNEIMPFAATWMDLDIVILCEVRERQVSHNITHIKSQICYK